ncbi:MAG: hypothetical protein WAX89_04775 [Alphaproteobacteria bacterium]
MSATTLKTRAALNLHAVVPAQKVRRPKASVEVSKMLAEIEAAQAAWPQVRAFMCNERGQNAYVETAKRMADAMTRQQQELRAKVFQETRDLPASLLEDIEYIYDSGVSMYGEEARPDKFEAQKIFSAQKAFCTTPRALLHDLRRLADDLGFLMFSTTYLSAQGRPEARTPDGKALALFEQSMAALGMDTYVLAPPAYYGVQEHAKAKDPNLSTYDGIHGTLMAMTRQNVLTFRTVFQALAGLEKQVGDIRTRVQATEQNMLGVQKQMAALNKQVERVQLQLLAARQEYREGIAQARAYAAKIEQRLEKAEAQIQMILCMMDPLAFAVPKGTDIAAAEEVAYIGPCWGPDFPAIMAQAYVNGAFDPLKNGATITKQVKDIWYRN